MLEIRGHFDGTQILLDEPCELKPNTKVIVKVITEEEDADWTALGKKNFAKAYSDDEPDSDVDFINSGLRTDSLFRLGFLLVLSRSDILGSIGSISEARHMRQDIKDSFRT